MTVGAWHLRRGVLDLGVPRVVGTLNATPDSFSDGGLWNDPHRAWAHACAMIEDGADMIDLGGESTRPGAHPVSVSEELARILPVLDLLKQRSAVPISVDTRRAEVAGAALDAGADAINDVSALTDPRMGEVVARFGAGLVLMHMRGTPQTMQANAQYSDVAAEVTSELGAALRRAAAAGIATDHIVVDPGIGFAKTLEHNLDVLARLDQVVALGPPVMLGVSRKAFIGSILGGVPAEHRDVGTAAACVAGLFGGVRLFRVHDCRTARQALAVAEAIRNAGAVRA